MPVVHIPSLIQDLTHGSEKVTVAGKTVRQAIEALEHKFPGIRERLCSDGRVRPNIAVWIDGEMTRQGMIAEVGDQSHIHFLPAVSGGLDGVQGRTLCPPRGGLRSGKW